MVPDLAHVGFTAEIPLPNQGFPARFLGRAINEPAFGWIDPVVACQIRTNLANRLNSLGRPVAANEQWLKALEVQPDFAKAFANRAKGMAFFASTLYDSGHRVMLLAAARSSFDAALDECAVWESGDRASIAPNLIEERESVARFLTEVEYDEQFDTNQWSLGTTDEERSYRQWEGGFKFQRTALFAGDLFCQANRRTKIRVLAYDDCHVKSLFIGGPDQVQGDADVYTLL